MTDLCPICHVITAYVWEHEGKRFHACSALHASVVAESELGHCKMIQFDPREDRSEEADGFRKLVFNTTNDRHRRMPLYNDR